LAPEAVSVLDMQGNLLSRPRKVLLADGSQAPDGTLEYRQQVERDLLTKINGTLEPLLGPEKFRAGVSVDCDFTSGEQSEESFDPAKTVMTTSEVTEDIAGGTVPSGVPGTASNLPRPTSRPASSTAGLTRRTENTVYQASRVVKHTRLPQGGLKRMSIAVLVDHSVRWEGAGAKLRRIVEPPSPEKLKAIQELVAAATGFVKERGDQLIVESLPFESTLATEPSAPPAPAPPPSAWPPDWLRKIAPGVNPLILLAAGAGALLLVLIIVVVFLWRRIGREKCGPPAMHPELDAGPAAGGAEAGALEGAGRQLEAKLHEQAAIKERMDVEALKALKLPTVTSKKTEILSKHLTEEAKKDPVSTAQVLRTWLNERENRE
jgi:flagellar M-ring protein FliF